MKPQNDHEAVSQQSKQSSQPASSFPSTFPIPTGLIQKCMQLYDHFPTQSASSRITVIEAASQQLITKLKQFDSLTHTEKLQTIDNITIILDRIFEQGTKDDQIDQILQSWLGGVVARSQTDPKISNALLTKLPNIISFIQQRTSGSTFQQILKTAIIPTIASYLFRNEDFDTKHQASQYLINLSSKLNKKDHAQYILKYILLLSHDNHNEINRAIAVQLLGNACQYIDHDLCEQFIALEIVSLFDDSSQNVQINSVKILPEVCKVVSAHFFKSKILKHYYQKCAAGKNWSIRKVCAEVIVEIARYVPQEQKYGKLTSVMLDFLDEKSKEVRAAAYLNLGKFIFQLKGEAINKNIVKRYLSMADTNIVSLGSQNQIAYACAFQFPAVLNALGGSTWQKLFPLYEKLLKIEDNKIKLTLSSSLFQVAKIIGGAKTQKYLFSIISKLLQEETLDDEIKFGIIQKMYQIIFTLNDKKREELIVIFQEDEKNMKKWRTRVSIVKQFQYLLDIYSVELVYTYLFPILLSFCSDPVSIVREQAAKIIPFFVQSFQHKSIMLDALVESIKGYGYSKVHAQRLQFIAICKSLLPRHKKVFFYKLFGVLMELIDDKVVNVRLALAELIRDTLEDKRMMAENKEIFKKSEQKMLVISEILKKMTELKEKMTSSGQKEIEQVFKNLQ